MVNTALEELFSNNGNHSNQNNQKRT